MYYCRIQQNCQDQRDLGKHGGAVWPAASADFKIKIQNEKLILRLFTICFPLTPTAVWDQFYFLLTLKVKKNKTKKSKLFPTCLCISMLSPYDIS